VHWVTSIYVYCYAAPTCFGTYVPSSGSIFVPVSYVKTDTASGDVNCVICVLVLWCCSVLCFPTESVGYVKTETATGNVNCVICVPVLWCCSVLCFPTESVGYVNTETASGNVNCVICVPVLWCCAVLRN
jgi:hypothetical protein